jgi:hypothetical protein
MSNTQKWQDRSQHHLQVQFIAGLCGKCYIEFTGPFPRADHVLDEVAAQWYTKGRRTM